MNKLKSFKSLLLGILATVVVIATANADTIANVSKFTPDRPGVPFIEGMQGFPYPSFNNFIPLSTTTWAHFALGEPITPTFCAAMVLIVAGVALGQMDWAKIFREPESF